MKTPENLRPGEFVFALLILGFSLAALREAWLISGFKGLTTGGVVPMTAAALMVAASLVILVRIIRRMRERQLSEAQGADTTPALGTGKLAPIRAYLFPNRFLAFMVLLVLFCLAIPYIGFLTAAGSLLFIALMSLWDRGLIASAAVTITATLAIFIVFRLVFKVVLPTGSLW